MKIMDFISKMPTYFEQGKIKTVFFLSQRNVVKIKEMCSSLVILALGQNHWGVSFPPHPSNIEELSWKPFF